LFVGDFISNNITDRNSLSAFLSSVIPHSIAKAVGKQKNCRYTTSGDGSRFFCLFNKKGFFSIGGKKDFIGVAI
jgi:hypothetical protein